MRSFKYAFLNLKGQYRGDMMLLRLIESGFLPSIVIEEESALASKNRSVLLNDLKLNRGVEHNFVNLGVPCLTVSNHNNDEVMFAIIKYQIDLIVLGDCRIIKRRIFGIPQYGTINVHPGYLPIVRGNNPYIWALLYNLPQGCTAHLVDDGIDTGDIIVRKRIYLESIISYEDLLNEINEVCSELIVGVLMDFMKNGIIKAYKQSQFLSSSDTVNYFTCASDSIKKEALSYWD